VSAISRQQPHQTVRWSRYVVAAAASLLAVAAVTAAIFVLEPIAPVLSLGVLYLFAVLPVAALWGLAFALPVSLVSMLAFNWFFLPPTHTFRLADSENWVALAVYLVTAVSVSELAARARRRAAEAEQQRREAALAAAISAALLESGGVERHLDRIAEGVARLLGGTRGRIELEASGTPGEDETAYDLVVRDRLVGRLFVVTPEQASAEVVGRVLPVVASLLATALERERLVREAEESETRRRREAIEAEALRRNDAVKTAVLRSVSHDLRSPLTAIMTASEVLEDVGDALSPAETQELLASILLQVRKLDRLVANLLDLSRLEAGAARPLPELWTVDGLVARALEAIGPENERVEVVLPADSPPVSVDPAQLEQALVNVIENALKFSSPTDAVRVEVEHDAHEVLIRVIDRGPGIAAGERDRIFEPFQRGASEASTRGSGLGLAIARGFVVANGGRLSAEAQSTGAVFAVALPVASMPATAPR
jgi:two-component system, OmpR family, sensor histidine kinase KdpD